VVVKKMSEREAARQFGLARETVRKMLRYAVLSKNMPGG
jgi:transposase